MNAEKRKSKKKIIKVIPPETPTKKSSVIIQNTNSRHEEKLESKFQEENNVEDFKDEESNENDRMTYSKCTPCATIEEGMRNFSKDTLKKDSVRIDKIFDKNKDFI